MSKKKKRGSTVYGHARLKREPKKGGFTRFYRRNRQEIRKYSLWGIIGIVVISAAVFLVFTMESRSISSAKDEHLGAARRLFLLSRFDQAVVEYHQAQNASPNDKEIMREQTMAKARASFPNQTSLDNVIAAAQAVLTADSFAVVANLCLAEVNRDRSFAELCARRALDVSRREGYRVGIAASCLSLARYFRQIEKFDSALFLAEEALPIADLENDRGTSSRARLEAGLAALKLARLGEAKGYFEKVIQDVATNYPSLRDLAQVGLADYFHRVHSFDSALAYASLVEDRLRSEEESPTAAYATQLVGRVLRDTARYGEAIDKLEQSLRQWRTIGSLSDIIDNLNDLAIAHYAQKNLYQARKYYQAAGTLCGKFDFPQKNLYDADMNLRFLSRLSREEYLQSGDEGDALMTAITSGIP